MKIPSDATFFSFGNQGRRAPLLGELFQLKLERGIEVHFQLADGGVIISLADSHDGLDIATGENATIVFALPELARN
jgi:hypothetical protein